MMNHILWTPIAEQANGGCGPYMDRPGRAAQQRTAELAAVLAFLSTAFRDGGRPLRILEIGVHDAGSLWAWGHLIRDSGGQIFGVDQSDANIRKENLQDLEDIGLDVRLFIGDSRDPATVERVGYGFTGPVDFLFIDADHARERVMQDYLTWRGMVADDGVIGFHDTLVASKEGWEDVLAIQDDALAINFTRLDGNIARMGIGLLVKGTPL